MAVIELTADNFEQVVTGNSTVFIDFWAPWCAPCRSFAPTYEAVAVENPDVVFAKVNTEEQQSLAAHFQIRSIPTLMIFRDQIIIFSQAGALPKTQLQEVIEKAKSLDMDKVRAEIAKQQQA
ncbi:thioredoxin [Beggiatoa alba B18LD]|uniref:Thioredoxin n=1 Tax=Beggiatoa alba B18LD TaxID=395493 RepID=I3CIQ6_9GAMM|nr:thioredoxin [Beggiatoa alba]EIJ43499.1 thioredoxin [Beggiatoa alba B18LD]